MSQGVEARLKQSYTIFEGSGGMPLRSYGYLICINCHFQCNFGVKELG